MFCALNFCADFRFVIFGIPCCQKWDSGNPRKAAPMNFSFFSSKRLIKSSKTSKLAAIPVEGMLAFTTVVTNSGCAFVFLGNTGRSHSSLEQDNHLVRGSYQRYGRVVII